MNERAGPAYDPGHLLQLQLSVMRGTLGMFVHGTQRFLELSLAAAASPARRQYTVQVQENVDSILHAFAMAPAMADRLIRTSALRTDGPVATATRTPPRAAKPKQPRRTARAAGEHPR
ncbi:hypothetical protein [Ramlibacter sp.]|uniref:hypothetical protein n=1 Tax=Ramlibacter sp. TaxID=1917967 RepID=UPI002CD72283|nr:hypothetical protein [Ramlibacter sp.]HWI81981.1 hypothetical protein [Ramlibacter sp.]